jgi:hypothetical protein
LVGNGAHLASLVFYFVIHTHATQHGPITRETAGALLTTIMECRIHFDHQLEEWAPARCGQAPLAIARQLLEPALDQSIRRL